MSGWLTQQKPKLADINALVHLIVQGLECWNKNESVLIQGVSFQWCDLNKICKCQMFLLETWKRERKSIAVGMNGNGKILCFQIQKMSKIPKLVQLYRMQSKSVKAIVNGILNELINSLTTEIEFCRICRLGDSASNQLIKCPCVCIGSIGHIHIDCYRLWRKVTGRHVCEICRHAFRRVGCERSQWQLAVIRMRRFFTSYYSVNILKRILYIVCTMPLILLNIHDVFDAIDAMNLFELTSSEMAMFTYLLLTSDLLFTTYLIWTVENVSRLDQLVKYWWSDTDDLSVETMDDSPEGSFESFFDAFIFL